MEEIRLYHSSWLDYFVLLCGLAIMYGIATASSIEGSLVFTWLICLSWLILEGLFLYRVVRSKILKIPDVIITDEHVKVEMPMRKSIIKFSDVHSFELVYMSKTIYVGINYNIGVKSWKDKKMNAFVYWWKSVNNCGYDEVIPVSDLTFSEQDILDLLDEKLENYRKKEYESN